ncbi:23S rRNA (adenine2030-N6)-methyltransferase [Marinobacter daqiaonensis]|uniref:Ribosomal RNA large subunit methyltransferase J n=1 Tax=Marinobacter daqiaonensis TaxID=650891 RepID=A0A1I6HF25_9GAMM|nr:23S rRNA (adenine(2030)-N(6))-methyltransferase RlmJ [Marinobacter daqiaonensis]SFR52984.1 23S rRNA (adenine2030-N6)-methyltransferase [Marinobacter daqiaonensis]
MLSYLHEFHAGNFADVQKHVTLMLVLTMMQGKASGIACFDTHAGSALYDLEGDRARKTAEAEQGVQRIWRMRDQLRLPDWQAWFSVLDAVNEGGNQLNRYPGSPAWFTHCLRRQDTLTAFELHSMESSRLARWAQQQRLRVLPQDGLKGLLGQLPPPQPRLAVLVDPSYELKEDYGRVADTLARAWQRCRHGVFLVWYPILTGGGHRVLLDRIAAGPVRKVWQQEVHLENPPERGMTGSGMLVGNPPWGLDERLAAMLDAVSGNEGLNISRQQAWLVPE